MKFIKIHFFLCFGLSCLAGCGKREVRNDCCGTAIEISAYRRDSVFIYFPNAFTPNSDGVNDFFLPVTKGIVSVELNIFKGNNPVFKSTDPKTGWNGIYNGKVKDGIFRCEAHLLSIHGDEVFAKGEVCLITQPLKRMDHCGQCQFGDMVEPTGFSITTRETAGNCR